MYPQDLDQVGVHFVMLIFSYKNISAELKLEYFK